jgi:hypothetical protein
MNRKEKYDDFDQWEMDVFRAGATQVLEVGDNIFYAIRTADNKPVKTDADGMFDLRSRRGREVMKNAITIGGWAGELGEIYRHLAAKAGKANPASRKENYMFKEEMANPRGGTAGLHFIAVLDSEGNSSLHVFDSEDQAGLYHGRLRGYGGIKRIGRAKGSSKLSMDYIIGATAKQFGSKPEVIRHDAASNPVTRRKGESVRDFTSRCMSEEKASFPEPKQRIAVCLSKSRKRNPLESGASISDDEDINARASDMG